MKKIIIICFVLFTHIANAQMASGSLFSSMKSINPAVIGKRPAGQITAIAKKVKIEKEQQFTSPFSGKTVINADLDSYNLFRGGKGGGFLTSEILVDSTSGTRKTVLYDTNSTFTFDDKVSSTFGDLGIALGSILGFSYAHIGYDYSQNASGSIGGSVLTFNNKIKLNQDDLKIGLAYTLFGLDMGLFWQNIIGKREAVSNGTTSSAKTTDSILGLGLGFSRSFYHFEAGYERNLKAKTDLANISYTASRISGTTELKLGNFSFGYTGLYYQGGFEDLSTLLHDQMAYTTSQYDPRLENIFNFAYGASTGLSISGSMSSTKIKNQEKSILFANVSQKFDTTTSVKTYSVQIGYVF